MSAFANILQEIREESVNKRVQGHKFEKLMVAFLKTNPYYATQFTDVWLWSEFAKNNGIHANDTGIDLVAQTTDNTYWAIQCKSNDETTTIQKEDVDTFLATSGKTYTINGIAGIGFSHRLWIDTTHYQWSKNAKETIANQAIPVNTLHLHELESAAVDWDKLKTGLWGKAARNPQKTPREHQTTAIEQTIAHFKNHDRGKLIMACGTGKTYTSLRIAEDYTQQRGKILFLVPSIALLGQTLGEWYNEKRGEVIHDVCVCSDPHVSKKKVKEDTGDIALEDLAYPATTNVNVIVSNMQKNLLHTTGLSVVFATYQSIAKVAEAQQRLLNNGIDATFDLIICDEAHRYTVYGLQRNKR
ncbi:MAG: hypothetical protein EBX41_06740 [Chitinophagia bacterium]|nr:hypothetical protein [Chitinophagia bacterium]